MNGIGDQLATHGGSQLNLASLVGPFHARRADQQSGPPRHSAGTPVIADPETGLGGKTPDSD
jgi:hypothetical protein